MTVFLGALPHFTDEEELRVHFSKILPNGQEDIENLRLIRDQETLMGKGIGYLLLKNQDAMIQVLQSKEKFKKREIRISTCGKRTKRTEKRKKPNNQNETDNNEDSNKKMKKVEEEPELSIGEEKTQRSINEKMRIEEKKESQEAKNAIAASKRIVAKMNKAKEMIGRKKKVDNTKINTGKKTTTKQLGGVLRRAIKASSGKAVAGVKNNYNKMKKK